MMIKKIARFLFYSLAYICLIIPARAQEHTLNFKEPDIRNMPLGSYLKGIYTIQEAATGRYLKHAADEKGALATMDANDERFYFWIVENLYQDYFQLYSTVDKGAAMSIGDDGVPMFSTGGLGASDQLLFRMSARGPETTAADKAAGIVAKAYITTVAGVAGTTAPDCDCKIMQIGSSSGTFLLRKVDFTVDIYYPMTFEKAEPLVNGNKGTITEDVSNRWTQLDQQENGQVNNFVSSRFYVGGYGTDDFRVTIEAGTEGMVGFVDYTKHDLASKVYKSAIPKVGIKAHNGVISLVFGAGGQDLPRSGASLFGGEVLTDFKFGVPITFGFDQQEELVATQNKSVFKLSLNDPTEHFVNQSITQSTRMLVQLEKGRVKLSYTLKNALVNLREDFGSDDGADYYSSDAYFPHVPGGEIANTFDWTQTRWPVRYQDGGVRQAAVFSPFYESADYYGSISAKFDPGTGAYIGGEDFSHQEGWELVKADLGYNANGTARAQPPGLPYTMFYDRVAGILRVMVYAKNEGEANQLVLSLNTDNNTDYRPRMWGGMAQFTTLDQVVPSAFSQPITFYSSPGRQWYFADFYLEFDPCVCFFESNFTLAVYKETKGELSIIGRLSGGSVPAGTEAYDSWSEHQEDYLMSVMNNDFGSLENTLGTTVFNQYKEFDLVDYADDINGTLVGKPIEAWEQEAARLEWEGNQQAGKAKVAGGSFLVLEGAATVLEGVAKMSQNGFLDLGGKQSEGAAKIAQGVFKTARGATVIREGKGKLKVASAKKLRYDAIKDKAKRGDQDIHLVAPPPRPHVVFGDLALQGTLTITTQMLRDGDGRMVTPGGQNPCTGPGCEWYNNGMLGAQPLYDKPLGNFNLLNQPEFGVAITQNEHRFKAFLKIKEKPYFVYNNSAWGKIDDVLGIALHVQTYRKVMGSDGKVDYQNANTTSSGSGYSMLIGLDGGLVGTHDISDLIDWEVIRANLAVDPSVNIREELSKWVTVSYEVSSLTMTSLIARDLSRAFATGSFIYEGKTAFAHATSNKYGDGLLEDAQTLSNAQLSEFNFADRTGFGSNYNIYYSDFDETGDEMYAAMSDYCQDLKAAASASRKPTHPIEELNPEHETGLLIYPNPAQTDVNFRLTLDQEGEVIIGLFDLDGKKLIETSEQLIDTYHIEGRVNTQPLPSGIYFIRVQLPDGQVIQRKIIRK